MFCCNLISISLQFVVIDTPFETKFADLLCIEITGESIYYRLSVLQIMGGCRCSYKTCKSATKTHQELHFFHYPVKTRDRCLEWIRNAEKMDFGYLPNDQLRNKVVCGLHFQDNCFTNELRRRLVHDAIPTLDVGCDAEPERTVPAYSTFIDGNLATIKQTSADGSIFSLDTESYSMQQKQANMLKYNFLNGNLIPTNNRISKRVKTERYDSYDDDYDNVLDVPISDDNHMEFEQDHEDEMCAENQQQNYPELEVQNAMDAYVVTYVDDPLDVTDNHHNQDEDHDLETDEDDDGEPQRRIPGIDARIPDANDCILQLDEEEILASNNAPQGAQGTNMNHASNLMMNNQQIHRDDESDEVEEVDHDEQEESDNDDCELITVAVADEDDAREGDQDDDVIVGGSVDASALFSDVQLSPPQNQSPTPVVRTVRAVVARRSGASAQGVKRAHEHIQRRDQEEYQRSLPPIQHKPPTASAAQPPQSQHPRPSYQSHAVTPSVTPPAAKRDRPNTAAPTEKKSFTFVTSGAPRRPPPATSLPPTSSSTSSSTSPGTASAPAVIRSTFMEGGGGAGGSAGKTTTKVLRPHIHTIIPGPGVRVPSQFTTTQPSAPQRPPQSPRASAPSNPPTTPYVASRSNNVRRQRDYQYLLNELPEDVPSALYCMLDIHLHRKRSNFNAAEIEFLTGLYTTSPRAYGMMRNRMRFMLPEEDVVKELLELREN